MRARHAGVGGHAAPGTTPAGSRVTSTTTNKADPATTATTQATLLTGDRVESQVEGRYGTKNQRLAPIFRALVLVPVRQHTR